MPLRERLTERPDFRNLFEHLEDISIWTVEESGEYGYISPGFEDIWGIPTEEAKTDVDKVIEGVHPEDRGEVAELVERPEEELGPESIEARVVHSDGSVRWVETRLFPIRDDDGNVVELVGISIDITERKRRREELEVLNRVLRHDVRNDMTVVLGWLDQLEASVPEDDREALERVRRASEHVVELTEIAREFVDVVVGDEEFDLEPVAVADVLEGEIEARREMYPDASFAVDGALPDVDVAANDLLASVFRNLLNNAVQHNRSPSPAVEVRVDVDDDRDVVLVCVADDGPGVPDAQKEAIFGKGESSLDSPGTGMGLYLSREIVTAYGGDIWVEDGDSRGAVFCVELPRSGR